MKIKSENIRDYMRINYDIEEFNNPSELDKVDLLVINSYNYSFETIELYPEELKFFRNLKKCVFLNFEITNEIIDSLNQIKLKELSFDNCNCLYDNDLYVEKLYIETSNIDLSKVKDLKKLRILEGDTIDISDIQGDSLEELILLNSNIINSNLLSLYKNCKIEIIGCTLDDQSITSLDNIKYNPNKYYDIY